MPQRSAYLARVPILAGPANPTRSGAAIAVAADAPEPVEDRLRVEGELGDDDGGKPGQIRAGDLEPERVVERARGYFRMPLGIARDADARDAVFLEGAALDQFAGWM